VPLQDRVEVCELLMAMGVRKQLSPVVGEIERARLTVPVNPFRLLSEIVVLATLLAGVV
jgi:hypothetical protein